MRVCRADRQGVALIVRPPALIDVGRRACRGGPASTWVGACWAGALCRRLRMEGDHAFGQPVRVEARAGAGRALVVFDALGDILNSVAEDRPLCPACKSRRRSRSGPVGRRCAAHRTASIILASGLEVGGLDRIRDRELAAVSVVGVLPPFLEYLPLAFPTERPALLGRGDRTAWRCH